MNTLFKSVLWTFLCIISLIIFSCSSNTDSEKYTTWEIYGGGNESIRYSTLDQIDTTNVTSLEKAWTYHTGDADTAKNSQIQHNPIIIGHTLYGVTPKMKLFALNAATGQEEWVFNPIPDTAEINHGITNNRGVAYWEDGDDHRILYVANSQLFAVDATTGEPVPSFGENGSIPLATGLGEESRDLYVSATSPGIVYEDLLILGSRVSEGADAASGDIRAFNVRTGDLEWTFHTIPHPGEKGYETWEDPEAWKRIGGANSWAGMSLDEERGIVFIPTGTASPDFYGGNRKGANLFGNTLLALDAATGELIWHYQTIHHDLWDRDLPSPPSLVTVTHDGQQIDAVAQTTKTGYVFLFNRETGEPLFPIEEKPVPTNSELEGEEVWPTQPVPTKPKPYTRQHLSEVDLNPFVSDEVREKLRKRLQELDSDHIFAPPSLNGVLMYPGYDGGAEWGGSAFDPETGLLYVNSNEVPWTLTMIPAGEEQPASSQQPQAMGRNLYMSNCVSCHGPDMDGSGNNPAIQNVEDNYEADELLNLVKNGRRMMPGFGHLGESETKAIVNYLLEEDYYDISANQEVTNSESRTSPYVMTGYHKFQTPEGYPASNPPWGTLNAINLNTGEYAWRIPLGEYPELAKQGISTTGTENYGGPVVTSGGLVLIAATLDSKIRAFHKKTGELLWEEQLPAAGFATPSMYQIDGKQYLVIACGGGKLGTTSGDEYVAFALPTE
ncbi:pyrroloquinoline quinone-dependent dehydrogenase [Aliifodinibius sp. S!AR15-10]|uniref:pyrroloquinoline quinone-dependent dehydrogenase n=1 Tax=Aliifodinibius sp. S!AR15-10 TaxID=2950437 RepID=UPI0028637653|nr:pyrroloquinoline quinone-dependent dehydrogenase [Aliifodinibius sp. S!AR15-10]MDR8390347.1 pyrroloquinoline quinone-dependent dehydrogenase [Aliifodinibius sp. S!AR15-10]